jgi:O-antigen/teichoic acid export membrane protein
MAGEFGSAPERPSSSVGWIYGSTTAFFLSGGLFYLYLARILPTNELGSVVVLGAIASLVSIGATLGLGGGFEHFLAYHASRSETGEVRALFRSSLLMAALLAMVAAGLVASLAGPLSSFFFHTRGYTTTLEVVGLYAGVSTAAVILQSVLIGLQRFVAFSAVYIVASVATYGTPILFLHFWPGVASVVYGWLVGATLGLALCAVVVLRVSLLPSARSNGPRSAWVGGRMFRGVLTYSIPILASTIVGTAGSYVDRLVLASLVNLSTVGIYNYAILLTTGSLFIAGPFATVLVPRISQSFGRREFNQIRAMGRTSTTLLVLGFVPFALGLAAVGPFLLHVLVGGGFIAASLPMALLLVIAALSIPYAILVSLASGIRRTSVLMYASGSALLANIGLSVLLVPRLGMIGAAIGNSSMYWVALVVLYLALQGSDLVRFDTRSIARIWLVSACMAAVIAIPLALFGYQPILVAVFGLAGIGVLLVGLRSTRAIPDDAVDAIHRFLPRWAGAMRPLICWSAACELCHHPQVWSPAVRTVDTDVR